MSENKICKEVADAQLIEYFDYLDFDIPDLDVKKADIQDSSSRARRSIFDKLSLAIQKGRISISKDFLVTQHLVDGSSLEYKRVNGLAKIEMEKNPAASNTEKSYVLLGYLSGKGLGVVSLLFGTDLSTAEWLGAAFQAE